jgi:hypothetical protein
MKPFDMFIVTIIVTAVFVVALIAALHGASPAIFFLVVSALALGAIGSAAWRGGYS